MTTSAKALSFDPDTMWVELTDGRVIGVPLAWFPRLLYATPEQRDCGRIGYGGEGLHWEDLDEDISVAGLLAGRGDQTQRQPEPRPEPRPILVRGWVSRRPEPRPTDSPAE